MKREENDEDAQKTFEEYKEEEKLDETYKNGSSALVKIHTCQGSEKHK